jgi:hypothetical protein
MSYVRAGNSYVQKYIFFIRKRNNNSTNVSTNYSLLSSAVFCGVENGDSGLDFEWKNAVQNWVLKGYK